MSGGEVVVAGRTLVDLRPFHAADGRRVDPVDRNAADLVAPEVARQGRFVVYARTPRRLYAAAVWPPSPDTLAALAGLGLPVVVGRIEADGLRAVHERLWGGGRARLGELLARAGKVAAEEVSRALERQRRQGGRLGQHLVAEGRVTHWDLAEAVARQAGLALVDLVSGRGVRPPAALFALADETFWRDRLCVPLAEGGGILTLAMVDPSDRETVRALASRTGLAVRPVVTGYRDVLWALDAHYRDRRLAASTESLRRARPDDSAATPLSRGQRLTALALAAALAVGLARAPLATLTAALALCQGLYLAVLLFRLAMIGSAGAAGPEVRIDPAEVAALDEASLPPYTVLVAAYHEEKVLPTLARALAALDYPKDRLEVKLLLEADDPGTVNAARALSLPPYVDIVVVPPAPPRTKPKALNYGLAQARGRYLVIYDAEDLPESDQLKKAVIAFRRSPPDVACVQAKLSYFNADENLLTRWFTAEYAMWFDVLLPALHARRLPIPLGGTSNHFRTDALRAVGMWDPYNVAEDADLGMRLHKLGYRTVVMDSTTYEEANSEFVNWVRQRSRWTKGYMQTWLVHMRHPLRLWRELGGRGFAAFQLMVGGTPAMLLVTPVLWALTTAWFLTRARLVPDLFPAPLYYLSLFNLAVSNFAFTYLDLVGIARRGAWRLVRWALFAPAYWSIMPIAAWKAAWQVVRRPSFWEKTEHGLTAIRPEDAQPGAMA